MDQLSLFSFSLSVSELTRRVRELLEEDEFMQDVWVRGEVSNARQATSGHVYFTLKDKGAALSCTLWKPLAMRLRWRELLQEGLSVDAHGGLRVYEAGGTYSLNVDALRPAGEGLLYREFLRLKEKLENEGLFDSSRKRPLPAMPQRIGIITAPGSAALQDMLRTLKNRYPLAEVILAPAAVQGDDAPPQLAAAIAGLNSYAHPDVIILGRGGGSLEDLWAFNDERVVRAVAGSLAPVVTGVGHETDTTLVDFCADLRAPTPTGAVNMATPDISELKASLLTWRGRLLMAAQGRLQGWRDNVENTTRRLRLLSPLRQVQDERRRLDDLDERAHRALKNTFSLRRSRLAGLSERLKALNPLAVLQRGFAVLKNESGEVLHNSAQVKPGERIYARLANGSLTAHVEKTNGG